MEYLGSFFGSMLAPKPFPMLLLLLFFFFFAKRDDDDDDDDGDNAPTMALCDEELG